MTSFFMGPWSYLHQFLQLALVDTGMPRQELHFLGQDGYTLGTVAEKVESNMNQVLIQDFMVVVPPTAPNREVGKCESMSLRCLLIVPCATPLSDAFTSDIDILSTKDH